MAKRLTLIAVLVAGMLLPAHTFAASKKTYQVTGTVVEVLPDAIILTKGNEHWEVRRDADTTMPGPDSIQAGDTVTITYTMHATSVVKKSGTKSTKKAK